MRHNLVDFVDAHLPELTDLWVAAWNAAMPAIDFELRRAWIVDRLTALRASGVDIVCAFDAANGGMTGFVTLDPASGHIDQLAVDPRCWGRGVATTLIAGAKSRTPHGLTLDVNQDNPRAVRFYEGCGFRRAAAGTNASSGLKTWRYEWNPA